MPKEIEIVIEKDGSFRIEAQGFKGPACEKALQDVMKGTGAHVKTDRKTKEFYEQEIHDERSQQ